MTQILSVVIVPQLSLLCQYLKEESPVREPKLTQFATQFYSAETSHATVKSYSKQKEILYSDTNVLEESTAVSLKSNFLFSCYLHPTENLRNLEDLPFISSEIVSHSTVKLRASASF